MIKFIFTIFFLLPIYGFKCLNASQFKKNTHEINRELLVKDQSQNNFLKDGNQKISLSSLTKCFVSKKDNLDFA